MRCLFSQDFSSALISDSLLDTSGKRRLEVSVSEQIQWTGLQDQKAVAVVQDRDWDLVDRIT